MDQLFISFDVYAALRRVWSSTHSSDHFAIALHERATAKRTAMQL